MTLSFTTLSTSGQTKIDLSLHFYNHKVFYRHSILWFYDSKRKKWQKKSQKSEKAITSPSLSKKDIKSQKNWLKAINL